MKAITEITLAVIFAVSANVISPIVVKDFKRESLLKVHRGLPSLSSFSNKLTKK